MDLASKKNAADVPPPPEGDAERQSSNNDTSCDIIPGRDVNMVAASQEGQQWTIGLQHARGLCGE